MPALNHRLMSSSPKEKTERERERERERKAMASILLQSLGCNVYALLSLQEIWKDEELLKDNGFDLETDGPIPEDGQGAGPAGQHGNARIRPE